MKIPKSPNKISQIINIAYLTPNYKIYNFFFKKKALNQSFRIKMSYHRSNNLIIKNELQHHTDVLHVE